MKINGYALFGALAALSAAAPAAAQDAPGDRRGAYGSIQLGVADVEDVDFAFLDEGGTFGGTGAQDRADFEVELKSALAISGALRAGRNRPGLHMSGRLLRHLPAELQAPGPPGGAPAIGQGWAG